MKVKIEIITNVDYGDHSQNNKENYEGVLEENILEYSNNNITTKILIKRDNFKI